MEENKPLPENDIEIKELDSADVDVESLGEFTEEGSNNKGDGKSLLLTVGVIIGIFALIFVGITFYSTSQSTPVTMEEMHQANMDGDLDETQGYIYNGFSFIKTDGLWWTDVRARNKIVRTPLHFSPKELEDIEITTSIDENFNKGENIYIAINPQTINKYYTLGISEFSMNIAKGINRIPVGSCSSEDPVCDNRSIISCENNPENKPVVQLEIAEETSIEMEGTCIKVSGQDMDFVRAIDRLLYQWYGVMK